ncbi:Predicted aminopeptidase [Pseudarcicella hirudinis]|uniref:Predicted aminopeptidase n=2 Tax=Pseudarcicella hirudinis TaxID=1079859 RepID=A0A1I5SK66_9BACT|nr:aminopeptidase [Pseudarcicella hirudinis]SFP71150.1 Predicted aminopeptidase [Pseudarcicella hirudinis]
MFLLRKQIQKRNRKRKISILFLLFFISGGLLAYWQRDWVKWGVSMAKGGLNVAFNTRPLEEVLKDPAVPDSLKKRIELIGEIKRFAIDSLGLKDNPKVYQTLFDQKGKPLVYLLTVAEKYELKAHPFYFPLIGTFTYKGFFNEEMAKHEQLYWESKGYDTDMGEGIAYSTLGWFPEPILSSMLYYHDGKLASLIIHEMTHGTIFVKDNHELSENMANFIGDYGAMRFLNFKFGKRSHGYKRYEQGKVVRIKLVKHINRGTLMLDSLYKTFSPEMTDKVKDSLKYHLIESILVKQDTLYKKNSKVSKFNFDKNNLPNDAFFVGFKTYNAKQNEFEELFKKRFKGDFPKFLNFLKNKYN